MGAWLKAFELEKLADIDWRFSALEGVNGRRCQKIIGEKSETLSFLRK